MSKILLIALGGLVVFSAMGYFFYSSFVRRANLSVYWQKRQIRNKGTDKIKKDIYSSELQLKAYQELIMLTIKCRNLVQKISLEINNLITQRSAKKPIQTIELHFLEIFLQENDQLVKNLKEIKIIQESKLPEETNNFLFQLTECMSDIHSIIENAISSLSDKHISSEKQSDFNRQITDRYTQVVELHKWVIHHFQKKFASMQAL